MLPAIGSAAARALPALLRRSLPAVGRTTISRLGSNVGKRYVGKSIIVDATIARGSWLSKVKGLVKKPGWIRDIAIWTGVDWAMDKFLGDDPESSSDTSGQKLIHQQILNQLADDDLGYSDLRSSVILNESKRVYTTRTNYLTDVVNNHLFTLGRIGGKVSNNDIVNEFKDLTDAEILFLNNALVGVIKLAAASSRKKESLLLAARQALCSINPSPVCSNGADAILTNKFQAELVENLAASQNLLFEGLVEANCTQAYEDMFDEGTKSFIDFFDLFGDNKMDEVSDETQINMHLAHVNYKGSPTTFGEGVMNWLKEFSVDSDGLDDESDAVRNLQRINEVHPRVTRFTQSLIQDENNRADNQLL